MVRPIPTTDPSGRIVAARFVSTFVRFSCALNNRAGFVQGPSGLLLHVRYVGRRELTFAGVGQDALANVFPSAHCVQGGGGGAASSAPVYHMTHSPVGSCANASKTSSLRSKWTPSVEVAWMMREFVRQDWIPHPPAISEAHMWKIGGVAASLSTTAPPQVETLAPPASVSRRPAVRVVGSSTSVWQRSPVHATSQRHKLLPSHTPLSEQSSSVAQGCGGHATRPAVALGTLVFREKVHSSASTRRTRPRPPRGL
mmetsp:Transcript_32290/g.99906  ORF Transcript_32290/g.99906 Transcript_32290/m.99906 type:complete len:255 (+) Transcript_32290:519-1283(+)